MVEEILRKIQAGIIILTLCTGICLSGVLKSKRLVGIVSDIKIIDQGLKDPEYKKSFNSMESVLLKQRTITLPAPIIVNFSGLFFGFAGNRRMNLAIKYGIPLKAWRVNVSEKASSIDTFLAGI